MDEYKMRIQRHLSLQGICSRRKAEQLILEGAVLVNGRPARLGDKVGESDRVEVLGKAVGARRGRRTYIMLNKPRGYVSTLSDELGRKCVAELIADAGERLVPVGRLDRDSEGLLLFTNDGEAVNRLTHPSHSVRKLYKVTVRGEAGAEQVKTLCAPMDIDGHTTRPANVFVLERQPDRTVLSFEIFEGRNRQIRRMCDAVSLEIMRLKRVAVGEIKLGGLPAGKWRELSEKEIRYIKNI